MPFKVLTVSDKTKLIEISAIVITTLGKFVFMDYLNWRFGFVVIAILGWSSYVTYKSRTQSNILRYWGFRTDNFKKVMLLVLPFGLVAIASSFVIDYMQGTLNLT